LYQYNSYLNLINERDIEFQRMPKQHMEKYKKYQKNKDKLMIKYLFVELILVTNPITDTIKLSESLIKEYNNKRIKNNSSKYRIEIYKITKENNEHYDPIFDDIPNLDDKLIDELKILSKNLKERGEKFSIYHNDINKFNIKSLIICKLLILLKNQENKIAGFCRLEIIKPNIGSRKYTTDHFTISMLPNFRGKGLCTNFVSNIYRVLLDENKIESVSLTIASDNMFRACPCYLKAAINNSYNIEIFSSDYKTSIQIKNTSDINKHCDMKKTWGSHILVTK